MALPAKNRLPLRKERDRLTREGKTYHTKFFAIVSAPSVIPTSTSFRPSDTSGEISLHPRFSILLSKKTAKLAVDRNRIKRVTSAILIELLPSFSPADYLIIPKSSVIDTSHPNLLSDLESFLSSSRA